MNTLQTETKEKLDGLWKTYGKVVETHSVYWAGKSGRDPSDVWDSCLDAFFKAADTWESEGGAPFKTWLIGALRQRTRRWSQKEIERAEKYPTESYDTGLDNLISEAKEALLQKIIGLSPGSRQIVHLILDLSPVFEAAYKPLKGLQDLLLDIGWKGLEVEAAIAEIREELL